MLLEPVTVTLEMLASDKENKRMSQQHLFWDNLMATTPHSMYVNAEDCYLSSGVVSDGAFEMDKRETEEDCSHYYLYANGTCVLDTGCMLGNNPRCHIDGK